MKILLITGPPYSGKGTQCEMLEKKMKYKHVSTGDLVRKEKESGSALGLEMKGYEEQGRLVPDERMAVLLNRVLEENSGETGIILDGYPRTIEQVDFLIALLEKRNQAIDKAINIEVPKKELLKRAAFRAKTSEREDDKDIETHKRRIEVFERDTKPAIQRLKTKIPVAVVDGRGSIEEIFGKISEILTGL
jgi:adenylate kinase